MSKPWHYHLPWGWFQRNYRAFRRALFTKPKPDPTFHVKTTLYDVRGALGRQGYAPNWEFSYNYRGEDLNLASVFYRGEREPIVWWQHHVRGWEQPDGTVHLAVHHEPEPTEHPKPHLAGTEASLEPAKRDVKAVLDDANIAYTEA